MAVSLRTRRLGATTLAFLILGLGTALALVGVEAQQRQLDRQATVLKAQNIALAKANVALATEARARAEAVYGVCKEQRAALRENLSNLILDFIRNDEVGQRLTERIARDFDPDDCIKP